MTMLKNLRVPTVLWVLITSVSANAQ
ncbi:uncharacterized protein METZ01_LOCUS356228, partial [marine metagenome]